MLYDELEKNFKISEMIKKSFFKSKKIGEKLVLAQEYGSYCWRNRTGKFSDYEIEEELIKIANKYLKREEELIIKKRTLHILTTAYSVGGHTRLVNTWIEFFNNDQDIFLINQKEIPNFLNETIKKANGTLYISKKNTILEKAEELYNYAKEYERIILHIHPNDIIPILALGNTKLIERVYYLNHADHVFWYGITINKCVLDLTMEGHELTLVKRGVINSEIINIPIQSLKIENTQKEGNLKRKYNIPLNAQIIFSMAAEYKYRILDKKSKYSFYIFLEKLIPILEKLDIYYFIAGPNKEDKNWDEIISKSNSRIILLGNVEKEEVKKIWKDIDLYIDSFPINSYTCVLEALCNNKMVYSLKTSIFDLEVMKDLKVNDIKKLIEIIENYFINAKNINTENTNVKNKLIKYHYKKNWIFNLKTIYLKNDNKFLKNYKKRINIFWDEYELFFYENKRINLKKKIKYFFKSKI